MLCNTNGLLRHKSELEIYLYHKCTNIILLTETPLTSRFIRKDNPDNTTHGGKAILKFNLKHYTMYVDSTAQIQIIFIQLLTKYKNITLASTNWKLKYIITEQILVDVFESRGKWFLTGQDNAENTRRDLPDYQFKMSDILEIFVSKDLMTLSINITTETDLGSDYHPCEPDGSCGDLFIRKRIVVHPRYKELGHIK